MFVTIADPTSHRTQAAEYCAAACCCCSAVLRLLCKRSSTDDDDSDPDKDAAFQTGVITGVAKASNGGSNGSDAAHTSAEDCLSPDHIGIGIELQKQTGERVGFMADANHPQHQHPEVAGTDRSGLRDVQY